MLLDEFRLLTQLQDLFSRTYWKPEEEKRLSLLPALQLISLFLTSVEN